MLSFLSNSPELASCSGDTPPPARSRDLREGGRAPPPCLPPTFSAQAALPTPICRSHSLLKPARLPPRPGCSPPPQHGRAGHLQLRPTEGRSGYSSCKYWRGGLSPALDTARGPLLLGPSLVSRVHTVWLSHAWPDRPGRPLKEDDIYNMKDTRNKKP